MDERSSMVLEGVAKANLVLDEIPNNASFVLGATDENAVCHRSRKACDWLDMPTKSLDWA